MVVLFGFIGGMGANSLNVHFANTVTILITLLDKIDLTFPLLMIAALLSVLRFCLIVSVVMVKNGKNTLTLADLN